MRNADELKHIDGMKYLCSAPKGETIVSIVRHDDELYIATDKHVYKLVDDKRLELEA